MVSPNTTSSSDVTVRGFSLTEAEKDSALWQQARKVRISVFVDEQKVPLEREVDDLDFTSAYHFILSAPDIREEKGEVAQRSAVGTVRVFIPSSEVTSSETTAATLGRLAVLASHRGLGYSKVLMMHAEDHARDVFRASRMEIHAQLDKVKFYQQLGYILDERHNQDPDVDGDGVFWEEGIPHKHMVKIL